MLLCVCAYGVKSEISLVTGDSACNAVVKRSVFINRRCAECVCLYTMNFMSAGKNTLLLYATVCEKVVPWLNKYDDVIEWNFMKIPPRNEELVAPLPTVIPVGITRCQLVIKKKFLPLINFSVHSSHLPRRLCCPRDVTHGGSLMLMFER